MTKYLRISSYIRKPFLIYDFACNRYHLNFLKYEENFIFFFYQCIGMIGIKIANKGDVVIKDLTITIAERYGLGLYLCR